MQDKINLSALVRFFVSVLLLFALAPGGWAQTQCGVSTSCLITEPGNGGWRCINGNQTIQQLTTGTNPILLPASQAVTTPQHVIVNGFITFNQSYTFAPGSELVFAPAKGLNVDTDKELVIKGSWLHGCSEIWQGITVSFGGIIRLEGNTIEDAFTAVLMKSGVGSAAGSKISVVNNTFRKNYTCLYLGDVPSPAVPIKMSTLKNGIIGNTFNGADNLLPGSTVTRPRYGIVVNSITPITIGGAANPSAFTPNLFTGYDDPNELTYAIWINRSTVKVQHSRFENIGDLDAIGETGYGIFFQGVEGTYELSVDGLGQTNTVQPTFKNVSVPIFMSSGHLKANQILSELSRWGIYYRVFGPSSVPTSIDIRHCTFDGYRGIAGILIQVSSFVAKDLTIRDCEFFDNVEFFDTGEAGRPRCGVDIYASGQPLSLNNGVIIENKFYNEPKSLDNMPYKNCGIKLTNVQSGYVDGNQIYDNDDITVNQEKRYQGIWLDRCHNVNVTNNTIHGTNFSYFTGNKLSTAIDVYESGFCFFSCNDLNLLDRGVAFQGENCDHTNLGKTFFNIHNNALYLFSDAITGEQSKKENRWYTQFPLQGNFDFSNFDPGVPLHLARVAMSKFWINNADQNSIFWATPRLIGAETDNNYWFEYNPMLPAPPGEIQCHDCCFEVAEKSRADNLILVGTFPPYRDYPASIWEAQFRLFDNLYRHPALRPAGSAAEIFYNTHSTGTLGQLYGIWRQVVDAGKPDATTEVLLNAAYDAQEDIWAQLYALEEQIAMAANETEEAQLLAQRETLLDQMISHEEAYRELLEDYQVVEKQEAATHLEALNSIAVESVWETNLKTVLQVQLELFVNGGPLSGPQHTILQDIADQCRYAGGLGVLLARVTLPVQEYDDGLLCGERSNSGFQGSAARVTVQPNPASDHLSLHIGEPFAEGQILLRDAMGRAVRNLILTQSEESFSTADLPAGTYFLSIWLDNQLLLTRKVVLIK